MISRRSRFGLAAGAITVAAVVGVLRLRSADAAPAGAPADETRPHVETALPIRKTVYRRLKVPGETLPFEQAALHARVPGYLEAIPVDRGSVVKAGDVLARIAVPELENQLEREKAELAACAPAIAREEAEFAWREAIHTRLKDVAAKTPNLVNPEMLDDAVGRYEMAKAERDVTKSREPVLRAAVAKTQTLIGFAAIKAPFDGVVTERWVDPGQLIQPAITKILHLMRTDPVRVRIHVPQSDVPAIRPDSRAKVSFDELPGKSFEVPVARLFWALNPNTKTMAAEVDVKNPEGAIRPGMYAHVLVELDARPDALVLPAGALVVEKKKTFVYIVRGEAAKKTPVVVGIDDGIEFEVREGLRDNDEVIVTGKNLVTDGDPVRTTRRP